MRHSPTRSLTTSRAQHPINLPRTLGHRALDLPRQNVPETRKRLHFPLQILVPALHQLHELPRVDVGVPGRIHVVDYLGRDLDGRGEGVVGVGVGVLLALFGWLVLGVRV